MRINNKEVNIDNLSLAEIEEAQSLKADELASYVYTMNVTTIISDSDLYYKQCISELNNLKKLSDKRWSLIKE